MARRSDHSREQLADMALAAAAALAERDGLRGVTARGIAREIGYTVGTLYNVFDNLDDLLRHMNAATMDALYEHVTAEPIDADPERALRGLAPREAEILRLYFGIRCEYPQRLGEIGKRFGLSHEGVRRIKEKALGKLRRTLLPSGHASSAI